MTARASSTLPVSCRDAAERRRFLRLLALALDGR